MTGDTALPDVDEYVWLIETGDQHSAALDGSCTGRQLPFVTVTEPRMTRQERRAIVKRWRRIPLRTRTEVMKLATRGERHPDDDIDAAAVAASRVTLHVRSFLDTTIFSVLLSLTLLTIALVWKEPFPRWVAGLGGSVCLVAALLQWEVRRQAKRVVALPRGSAECTNAYE